MQVDQLGPKGRGDDPLYLASRALLTAKEKLHDYPVVRLRSHLELGDPNAEVVISWPIKEPLRDFYAARTMDDIREL